ncbi:MAG TPA: hypothetical protein PKL67_08410 [Anaerolineae bacterium]|nr:hypothetical protein [Anaerolineae bacterium]
MLNELYEWIISGAGAALGVSVVQGFPTWGRPTLTPPVTALELFSWTPALPARIGQARARQSASFTFSLFARNEGEMLAMLDSFGAWGLGNASAEINGQRVDVGLSDGQRYQSETGAQQEAYAFQVTISCAWSR